jgi:hypothetical protein
VQLSLDYRPPGFGSPDGLGPSFQLAGNGSSEVVIDAYMEIKRLETWERLGCKRRGGARPALEPE